MTKDNKNTNPSEKSVLLNEKSLEEKKYELEQDKFAFEKEKLKVEKRKLFVTTLSSVLISLAIAFATVGTNLWLNSRQTDLKKSELYFDHFQDLEKQFYEYLSKKDTVNCIPLACDLKDIYKNIPDLIDTNSYVKFKNVCTSNSMLESAQSENIYITDQIAKQKIIFDSLEKILNNHQIGNSFKAEIKSKLAKLKEDGDTLKQRLKETESKFESSKSALDFSISATNQEQKCGGADRWAQKVLIDEEASEISPDDEETTIEKLIKINTDDIKVKSNTPRLPVEKKKYTIRNCFITKAKLEDDGDIHLTIEDGKENKLIAEIPDPACPDAQRSAYVQQFQSVRNYFLKYQNTFGQYQWDITGVFFVDKKHAFSFGIHSNIELHPVLKLSIKEKINGIQ